MIDDRCTVVCSRVAVAFNDPPKFPSNVPKNFVIDVTLKHTTPRKFSEFMMVCRVYDTYLRWRILTIILLGIRTPLWKIEKPRQLLILFKKSGLIIHLRECKKSRKYRSTILNNYSFLFWWIVMHHLRMPMKVRFQSSSIILPMITISRLRMERP